MKSLQDAVQSLLSQPAPEKLLALQGALLAQDQGDGAVEFALEIAGHFYAYLSELKSKMSARDYSELASHLDIGAVGVVALENVLAGAGDKLWQRLLLGAVAEGLMVAASRQYIKGWETETGLVHSQAVWYLTEVLWRTSVREQPHLPAEQRWQSIQSLLAPASEPDVPAPDKAILLGRVFQILLLTHLAQLLPAAAEGV
jgi:hypothetical protein